MAPAKPCVSPDFQRRDVNSGAQEPARIRQPDQYRVALATAPLPLTIPLLLRLIRGGGVGGALTAPPRLDGRWGMEKKSVQGWLDGEGETDRD